MKNFYKPGLRVSLIRLHLYLLKFIADILIFIFSLRSRGDDNNTTNNSKGKNTTRSPKDKNKPRNLMLSGFLFAKRAVKSKSKSEQQQDEQDSYGQYLSHKIYEHQLSLASRTQGIKLAEEIKSKRGLLSFSENYFPFAQDMTRAIGLVFLGVILFIHEGRSQTTSSVSRGNFTPERDINLIVHADTTTVDTAKIRRFYPKADLKKYPIIKYDVNFKRLGFPIKGEPLSDFILDFPLDIIDKDGNPRLSTLRELGTKEYLIIDLWAQFCAPCIKSMKKWESMLPEIEDKVVFMGLHPAYAYKTEHDSKLNGFQSEHILGRGADVLAYYFIGALVSGPTIWIKDGKFYGVSSGASKDRQYVKDILSGKLKAIPEQEEYKMIFRKEQTDE
jgi:hypothetical protein